LKKKVKSKTKQKSKKEDKKRREIFFAFCPKKEEQKQTKGAGIFFCFKRHPHSTFFLNDTLIIFTNSYYYARLRVSSS